MGGGREGEAGARGGPGRTRRPVRGDRAASLHCIRRRRENNRRRRRRPPALGAAAAARPVSARCPAAPAGPSCASPAPRGVRACPGTGKNNDNNKQNKIIKDGRAPPVLREPEVLEPLRGFGRSPAPRLPPAEGCPGTGRGSALLSPAPPALGKVCRGREEWRRAADGERRGCRECRGFPVPRRGEEAGPPSCCELQPGPPFPTLPGRGSAAPGGFPPPFPGPGTRLRFDGLQKLGDSSRGECGFVGGSPLPPTAGREPVGARFGLLPPLGAGAPRRDPPPHGTGDAGRGQ